jgi:glycosidase
VSQLRVAGSARDRFGLRAPDPSDPRGHVRLDPSTARRVAAAMNRARTDAGEPATVPSGDLVALGLLHEAWHALIERALGGARTERVAGAAEGAEQRLGSDEVARIERRFRDAFPAEEPSDGAGPLTRRVTSVEELLLVALANENPAAAPVRDVVTDEPLAEDPAYRPVIAEIERELGRLEVGPGGTSLPDLLRAPVRAAPTSLAGQLRYIRDRWSDLLPDDLLDRLVLGLDILAEEERGLHLRFGGGPGPGAAEPPSYAGLDAEPERFSPDREWMPRVVLLAKHTYVWLDQLSRRYGRDIRTLDGIPDEELDRLAAWGVTGLWLIGLWRRSRASERIKRLRGNPDAVASAYALDDYALAEDLGGDAAWWNLRERAWTRGIRLAADMVPNHMGVDSRWVVEHPERFLAVEEPPYPAYTFRGPNLSEDPRITIRLEDHYWDGTDAAVVFQRVDNASGETRYVYHGNDGTSFPWNDTAQLDYSREDVREAVIRTIVDVARRFPVIRFDAAMVLARRHVRRLWFPQPGHGGAIPSRAEHAVGDAEWQHLMPTEFWREVVDRLAAEAPDTLLLAEAFWLMEGYFVRTLGMHRVYNSAFMHMLRDEDNAGYRKAIRDTLEFDPAILGRYVNFMTNPDEAPAREQFGTGDKYFGIATLLATLPGLPMLGHGQIEGYNEKYGHEFRRASLDESPDAALVEHHERALVPLLRRRSWFADSRDFLLYDFVTDDGAIDPHVYAYTNGAGETRSLVVYHNRFGSTAGRIRDSVAVARKQDDGSKTLERRSLAEALGLPADDGGLFVAFRDERSGLEQLRLAREIREGGLWLELDAYRCHVLWEFREVRDDGRGLWARLARRLGGRGVPSLDDAVLDLELEPVHIALRRILSADEPGLADLAAFFDAAGEGAPDTRATSAAARLERLAPAAAELGEPPRAGALRSWAVLADLDRATFDRLRLFRPLEEAAIPAELVRAAVGLPRPSTLGGPSATLPARLLDAWLADAVARTALGVNEWQGTEYVQRDRLERLLDLAVAAETWDVAARASGASAAGRVVDRVRAAAESAGYAIPATRAALRDAGRRPSTGALDSREAPPAPDLQTGRPRGPATRR